MTPFITRTKHGKSFEYNLHGKPVASEQKHRIRGLIIPPAWHDVQIAVSSRAKVQATGSDNEGRKQYIYHPSYKSKQEHAKFSKTLIFGKRLPRLRRHIVKNMKRSKLDKKKIIACVLSLMDETYFRVGNEQYAIKHQTFGLTTLRSKHIKIHGDTVIFDFIGKSGQHQHKKITSRSIAVTLKKLDELPGYELFRYYDANETLQNLTSQDINDCIKVVMGHEFTAKDFRTWGGTLLACSELAKMKWDDDANERKKAVTACIKKVAIKLGNTPAVTKSSYIDPRVFELYDRPNVLSKIYKTKHDKNKQLQYCTDDEFRVLKALSYRGHLS